MTKVIGRNVKRRIEELEQQVATQAELLAFPETTNPWQVGTSSFKTKVSTTKAIRDNRPTLGRQKVYTVLVTRSCRLRVINRNIYLDLNRPRFLRSRSFKYS